MDVHEWPAEHISEAADLGDELRGQLCTWCWARGEGRGSFRRARPNSSWLCIQRHFFVLASAQLRYPLVDTHTAGNVRRDVYVAVLFDFTGWRIGRRGLPF